jgi:hypothetical protein
MMKKNRSWSETGITRRTFVATSAAAVAGTALAEPLFAQGVGEAPVESLSVGYWPGSIKGRWEAEISKGHPNLELQDSANVLLPDHTFIDRGAVFSITGFWRPAGRRATPLAVDVDVLYELEAGSEQPVFPFRAWSYGFTNGVAHATSPVRLSIPVHSSSDFQVRTRRRLFADGRQRVAGSNAGGGIDALTSFGVMHGSQVRLNPGTYFLAIPEAEAVARPSWADIQIARRGGRDLTLGGYGVLRTGSRLEPVDFTYLIISVEHGAGAA